MAPAPIITLTTDFGLVNEYVGAMKGVILTICPTAAIIDISHQIGPQDIAGGAFTLDRAWHYFPDGTVHLAVVDPGVGTTRRILAVEAQGHRFLAPDNGLLSAVLNGGGVSAIHEVTNGRLFLARCSSTFHGRDIFAPMAAHLAGGLTLDTVGPEVDLASCLTLPPARLEISQSAVVGEIIHVDHFGNLCTSITAEALSRLHGPLDQLLVEIGTTAICGISTSYLPGGDAPIIALFDSHDQLEIAVPNGSAATLLTARLGMVVAVRCSARIHST